MAIKSVINFILTFVIFINIAVTSTCFALDDKKIYKNIESLTGQVGHTKSIFIDNLKTIKSRIKSFIINEENTCILSLKNGEKYVLSYKTKIVDQKGKLIKCNNLSPNMLVEIIYFKKKGYNEGYPENGENIVTKLIIIGDSE